MKNRVTVNVGGRSYTLLATEGDEYVRQVAAFVNQKLEETALSGELSQVDCAMLTALNVADLHFKGREMTENLRRQLKVLLEEASKLKQELSEAKRELYKLQQQEGVVVTPPQPQEESPAPEVEAEPQEDVTPHTPTHEGEQDQ